MKKNKCPYISFDDAVEIANHDEVIYKRRDNGIILSDYQISILNSCGINYKNFSNIKDLVFNIEEYLFDNYLPELDEISKQLSEFIYYNYTNK